MSTKRQKVFEKPVTLFLDFLNPIPISVLCFSTPEKKLEYEFDEEILVRRQKQIDFGRQTIGYKRYLKMVPK